MEGDRIQVKSLHHQVELQRSPEHQSFANPRHSDRQVQRLELFLQHTGARLPGLQVSNPVHVSQETG